jgi:hypothetical protein
MPNSNKKPIFVHSLFRSGSTYFFNVFRRSTSGYYCYQEPLNEQLRWLNDDPEKLLEVDDIAAQSLRHPGLERPYFWEFHQIRDELRGLFEKSFCYDDFFVKDAQTLAENQSKYFTSLISNSKGRPVFQFCRSTGRISALKDLYGGTHIHLWRHPHDQWWSFKINNYFDAAIRLIYNAHNLPSVLRLVKHQCDISEYHDKYIEKEFEYARSHSFNADSNYFVFYAFWLYAFIESEKHSDITISIDRLSADYAYQSDIINALAQLGVDNIDFSDCKIPQNFFSNAEKAFYEEIESRVLEIFLSCGYEKTLLDEAVKHYRIAPEKINLTHAPIENSLVSTRNIVFRLLDQIVDVEVVAQLAEERAQKVEERAQMDVRHMQDEAVQREAKHKELSLLLIAKENALAATSGTVTYLENTIAESQDHSQWLELELNAAKVSVQELNDDLNRLYCSKSWRLTLPLRKLMLLLKWLIGILGPKINWVMRLPKRLIRWTAEKVVRYVLQRPRISSIARSMLSSLPVLSGKLRQFAIARGLITPLQNDPSAQGESERAGSGKQSAVLPLDPAFLTPNAHRIYLELKISMAESKKESSQCVS